MEKKYKKSTFTLVCYVLAAIMLVYAFYTIGSTISYLSSYFAAYGTSLSDNFGDAISYIVTSTIQPLAFAVLFFMAGLVLDEVRKLNPKYYLTDEEVAQLAAAKAAAKAAKKSAKEAKLAAAVEAENVEEVKKVAEDLAKKAPAKKAPAKKAPAKKTADK